MITTRSRGISNSNLAVRTIDQAGLSELPAGGCLFKILAPHGDKGRDRRRRRELWTFDGLSLSGAAAARRKMAPGSRPFQVETVSLSVWSLLRMTHRCAGRFREGHTRQITIIGRDLVGALELEFRGAPLYILNSCGKGSLAGADKMV